MSSGWIRETSTWSWSGWWYRKYAPKHKELAAAEAAARKAKRGLWADPNPIPPWDWRQKQREKEKEARSDVDSGCRHSLTYDAFTNN